jgi:uncharacterized protein YcfL
MLLLVYNNKKMKKLLALFILSIALTSCFSDTEELPVNDENATGITDTIDDNSNIDEEQNMDQNTSGTTDII